MNEIWGTFKSNVPHKEMLSYFTLANIANSSENLKQTKTSYRGQGRDTEQHSLSDGASEETVDDCG